MKANKLISKSEESGQALLLAVILMLMLALIAAAFVATVAFNMQTTTRTESGLVAQNLAEAGLRYADKMLTTSPRGADWRPEPAPDPASPLYAGYYDEIEDLRGWAAQGFTRYPDPYSDNPEFGRGHYLLKVEYWPHGQLAEPAGLSALERQRRAELSRFIKITSIGRVDDDPSVFRKVVAYKPILLTDYMLFVTNKDRSGAAAELGLNPWIDYNQNGAYDGATEDVASSWQGPIRVNADLLWHGVNRLTLFSDSGDPDILRGDDFEVAGNIINADANTSVDVSVDGGGFVPAAPSSSPAFDVMPDTFGEGTYLDSLATSNATVNPERSVEYVEPPSLETNSARSGNVSRYMALALEGLKADELYTQATSGGGDAGKWYFDDNGTPGNLADDIQTSAPYLINNGTDLVDTTQPRDSAGKPKLPLALNEPGRWSQRNYELVVDIAKAPACELYITPSDIWVKRSDYDENRSPEERTGWLAYPYPENGVIYAQGNVKVWGLLGESTLAQPRSLTIVSDGSIIIKGSLLRPSDVNPGVGLYDYENSACALLARQHVLVDPTAMAEAAPETVLTKREQLAPMDPRHYRVKPGAGILINWLNGRPLAGDVPAGSDLYFTMLHCAEFSDTTPLPNDSFVGGVALGVQSTNLLTGVTTANTLYDFDLGGGITNYVFNDPPLPNPPGLAPWQSNAVYPAWELRSFPANTAAGADQDYFDNTAGVRYQVRLADTSSFNYYHANWKLERLVASGGTMAPAGPGLILTISALIYAEEGTFAIVPGEWWDERLADLTYTWFDLNYNGVMDAGEDRNSLTQRFLRYNYGVRINGAISQNYTAPMSLVQDWANKWSYYRSGTGTWRSVDYAFDDSLRMNRWNNLNGTLDLAEENLPRLPALPCAPMLIMSEEQ